MSSGRRRLLCGNSVASIRRPSKDQLWHFLYRTKNLWRITANKTCGFYSITPLDIKETDATLRFHRRAEGKNRWVKNEMVRPTWSKWCIRFVAFSQANSPFTSLQRSACGAKGHQRHRMWVDGPPLSQSSPKKKHQWTKSPNLGKREFWGKPDVTFPTSSPLPSCQISKNFLDWISWNRVTDFWLTALNS